MKTGNLVDDELTRIKAECRELTEERDRLQQHLLAAAAIWDAVLVRETQALARELHDDLGQVLTALRMDISLFELQHQADDVLVDKAKGMLALTDRCMQAVCGLIGILRPINLEQGFASALERLCQDFGQRYKLPCTLTISSDCKGLSDARAIVIFRLLYEALNNIARHAGPCTVSITFNQAADVGLHVEICDNGCGFDVSEVIKGKSLGFSVMRESAFALGGRIEIISEKNAGTAVILHIPPEALFY